MRKRRRFEAGPRPTPGWR